MIKKNDVINLKIDSCTAQGSGVGRHEGIAIFVPMTAPGDEISAHILKVKPNYAFAKVNEILTPSPDRIQVDCPAYAKCGGCVFRHLSYEAETKIKADFVADCLKRIGKTDITPEPIIAADSRQGYRNKAQFPVAADADGIRMGFFASHSHRVTECRSCPLQPSEFEEILNAFEQYIRSCGVTVYDETAHRGLLRHIYLRRAHATGEIMVCAVINGNRLPEEERLVKILLAANPDIKSICINVNKEKTNVILGKKCRTLYGPDYITDVLCSLEFRLSALSFYQVNAVQAQRLYGKAAELARLTGRETVLDLYCGTGIIGLTMASKAKEIIGVEIIPEAIEDAKINAKINNINNARFICGDASFAAKELQKEGLRPDVVILDPPRKGCSADVLETVAEMAPDRIVYISCDPATQARDLTVLAPLGYTAEKACPVDMFPATGHVETVVLLSQRRPDTHIDIKFDLSELDITSAETKATYQEIKDYVLDKHGLKVSSLYISQVKAKCGIIERENYNKGKEGHRVPQCPKEKEDAIMDALQHFKMI